MQGTNAVEGWSTLCSSCCAAVQLIGCLRAGQNVASALQVAELVVEALSYGVRLTP